jgi:membrane protein DedA with SNARE-associated domain
MLDIFHQIIAIISNTLTAVSSNYWLFVLLVFLVCVGEAVFILGLLVPSLPILLLVGALISKNHLDFWPIFFAATAGGVVGDAISYWIGFWLKDRIKTVWPFKNYLPLIARGEVFFQHHGGKAIFIGRFVTGLKAVVPGIAGMLGMKWIYFTIINVLSAFVWAASHILRGYFAYDWLNSMGMNPELVMLLAATLLGVGFILIHYWKPILLLFTPLLGNYGKSLRARWQKPKPETPAS